VGKKAWNRLLRALNNYLRKKTSDDSNCSFDIHDAPHRYMPFSEFKHFLAKNLEVGLPQDKIDLICFKRKGAGLGFKKDLKD
jgi:hypothetical protein